MNPARRATADLDAELLHVDRLQASWAGPGSLVLGVRTYLGWIDVAGIFAGAAALDAIFVLSYLAVMGPGSDGCTSDFCVPNTEALVVAAVLRWASCAVFALVTAAAAIVVGRRTGRSWQLFLTAQLVMIALVSQISYAQISHDHALERAAATYAAHNQAPR